MMKKVTGLKVIAGFGAMVIVAGGLMLGLSGCNGERPPTEEPEEAAVVVDAMENQQYCPVMEGMPMDRSIYADHDGKRVYFCCAGCIGAFQDDPERYMEKLEELHAEDHDHDGHDHHHDHDH